MKQIMIALGIVAVGVASAFGEVTPDELLRTVDQMSPQQVYDFSQKLKARLWEPVPEGFFSRMAVDLGVDYGSLDTADMSALSLSGGPMDVETISGLNIGILWRLFSPKFRSGLRFGGWAATDSNLGDAGYSRADLSGGSVALAANYQWIRSDHWLLWTEIAPGAGSIRLDVVDTPSGKPTTFRSFDGSYAQVDLQAGLSLRANPVLAIFLSGGYHLTESLKLEEGGTKSAVEFDASGFYGRLGLSFNF